MARIDWANKSSNPPALKSLTPTNEALELNIKCAHFTAILWNESITESMPNMDPCYSAFGSQTVKKNLRNLVKSRKFSYNSL